MRKIVFIMLGLFILQVGLFSSANAQVKQVRIKVNGLACPFCAYGLEKKLKKLDGVGKVNISLNDGLAILDNKEGQSIPVAKLPAIVKDAGFSATEIALTGQGVVKKSKDAYILGIAHSREKIILENNEKLSSLLTALNGVAKAISVKGIISPKNMAEFDGQRLVLSVTWFEINKI